MRRQEIFDLMDENVRECNGYLQVSVVHTKNDEDRTFVIVNDEHVKNADIIRKYRALRPQLLRSTPYQSDIIQTRALNGGSSDNLPL